MQSVGNYLVKSIVAEVEEALVPFPVCDERHHDNTPSHPPKCGGHHPPQSFKPPSSKWQEGHSTPVPESQVIHSRRYKPHQKKHRTLVLGSVESSISGVVDDTHHCGEFLGLNVGVLDLIECSGSGFGWGIGSDGGDGGGSGSGSEEQAVTTFFFG